MQAVSIETGIPADTLRSWERRYGFPSPSRDESNRRVYSRQDVVAVTWLRDQTDRGQGISEAIAMLKGVLEAQEQHAAAGPPLSLSPVHTLTDALLEGDLAAAQVSWDRLALSVSPEGLIEHVLLPAHGRIASSTLPLSVRLRATSFLLRKAVVLFDCAAPDSGMHDVAIVTYKDGSTSVPAYTLAAALAREGFRVVNAIADLADATTMAILSDLPAGTPLIVVSDRPDEDLIDAAARVVGDQNLYLWWPHAAHHAGDERWLPASITGVRAAMANRDWA